MIVLVIEDHALVSDTICRGLRLSGHEAIPAESVPGAIQTLQLVQSIEGVISDGDIIGGSGVDVFRWSFQHRPALPWVFQSGQPEAVEAKLAEMGCAPPPTVVAKPWRSLDELLAHLVVDATTCRRRVIVNPRTGAL